jgi:predicted metalloprotease with PDZ domain
MIQLVADLLQGGDRPITLLAIREWMEANGLAEFYANHVAEPSVLPEVEPALRGIGFDTLEQEANLTYLGIRVEGGDSLGRIVDLDPDGPATLAGFKVGDRIFGFAPTRVS